MHFTAFDKTPHLPTVSLRPPVDMAAEACLIGTLGLLWLVSVSGFMFALLTYAGWL